MFLSNTFRAFQHRDYFIFWCGIFLGQTGSLIQVTAQGWLILQLTNSPFYLGLDGLCLGLPRVIFSAPGGAIVDRMNRRFLFTLTQSVFLLNALFLGFMTYAGLINVWHILAVSTLTGFMLSFEQPIRQACVHHLVPPSLLVNALSLYNLTFQGSFLFGPAIGGTLIPFIGTGGCFFLRALGAFCVLVTIFLIRIPETPPGREKKSLIKDIGEGLSIAWNTPIFFSLFTALAVTAFFAKPYQQFMPIFARDILYVGAPGLGMLLMAPGAGAILGGLALASITRFPKPDQLLLILAGGFGITTILFAVSRNFPLSLLMLFIGGAFNLTYTSCIMSLLQLHTSEATRGRILSLFGLLNRGLGPMGAFPVGILATWIGAPHTINLGIILGIGVSAYMIYGNTQLREASMVGGKKPSTAG